MAGGTHSTLLQGGRALGDLILVSPFTDGVIPVTGFPMACGSPLLGQHHPHDSNMQFGATL